MPPIVSRKKFGFTLRALHKKKELHPIFFLSQRSSFWIASFSVLAFVSGNMVGQHGWYLFWASVLGKEEIVYTGTVAPIAAVPNYTKWQAYGGDIREHTFRQVPVDVFMPLPTYTEKSASEPGSIYSVSYMGTYTGDNEGSGSHPGVDIRVPIGTPVLSIANGVVDSVKTDGGYGIVVTVRHPNVPDPTNPSQTTTLYSAYAHLSSALVQPGTVVSKGEKIALSGQTGFASGPHLHFQLDREEAPWHPYWPFTTAEQNGMSLVDAVNTGLHKARGFTYTVSPMLYAQRNYEQVAPITVAYVDPVDRLVDSVEQRRLSRLRTVQQVAVQPEPTPQPVYEKPIPSPVYVAKEEEPAPVIVRAEEVVSADVNVGLSPVPVASIRIRHDGFFSGRGWETITVELLDKDGNIATNPQLKDDLYMRTAYGEAEFRPSILQPNDFKNGEVKVLMLPRGRRTLVLQARPFTYTSAPMPFR